MDRRVRASLLAGPYDYDAADIRDLLDEILIVIPAIGDTVWMKTLDRTLARATRRY